MTPLNKIGNGGLHVLDQFLKELDATSEQVRRLLNDVRSSEIDFAKIQTELSLLCKDVRDMSNILRGGDKGLSLVTKVALMEENVKDLEEKIEKLEAAKAALEKERHDNIRASMQSISEIHLAEKAGHWQMKTAMVTGILSLVATGLNMLFQLFQ